MDNPRTKMTPPYPMGRPSGWMGGTALFFLVLLVAAPAWAQRLAVDAPVANVRSGPGTEYEILWKVERYHPLMVLETSGKWHRFRDFEGDQGWIHLSLVKKIPAVITVQPVCNIRSGPGTRHDIRFTVEKGIPFRRIGKRGNWLQVAHADGDRGWIHESLVW